MTNRVLYSKYNIIENDKIKDSKLRIMIHKINKIISENIKNISIREHNFIISKIEDIIYKEIVRNRKKGSKEIIKKIELLLSEYIKDKKPKHRKKLLRNIEDLIFSAILRKELQKDYDKSSKNSMILRDTKYNKKTNKFSIIRKRISGAEFRRELNRDFNYEINLYYKTPYQFLDYQDMLVGSMEETSNIAPNKSK